MKRGFPKALSAPHQAGFSLLEILVAIVIVSLGLLGLAGLQAASLRNNQLAYYRGIAAQQVYDMADRIRANQAGATAGNYDNLSATIPTDPGCFQTGCSVANMAVTDHSQWNTGNSRLLPGGVGTVTCVQGPGANCSNTPGALRVLRILVRWPQTGTDCRDGAGTLLFANTDCFIAEVSP
ncbi:MAG TPA: type IV pilus modification protein PilV [Thiobacillaceae bacterium]|nr:type IV pilus modification protein PilV [Thiobacillaceae bacterium]HNU65224.1 type IV pilus modification protein PilV [Thiobacillaceae bacterium]